MSAAETNDRGGDGDGAVRMSRPARMNLSGLGAVARRE